MKKKIIVYFWNFISNVRFWGIFPNYKLCKGCQVREDLDYNIKIAKKACERQSKHFGHLDMGVIFKIHTTESNIIKYSGGRSSELKNDVKNCQIMGFVTPLDYFFKKTGGEKS